MLINLKNLGGVMVKQCLKYFWGFIVILLICILFKINPTSDDSNLIIQSYEIYNNGEEIANLDDQNVNYQNYNNDIVGSIRIIGTNISRQIVQGEDNEYYLNHNVEKEEDINGSVFIDYRNNFEDRKILIYGHNARHLETVPFHELEKFTDEQFLKENNFIELELNGDKSVWQIFSVMITQDKKEHMKIKFDDLEWERHLDWLKQESLYDTGVNVNKFDRIITLQTCYYNPANSYLLISAKKVG